MPATTAAPPATVTVAATTATFAAPAARIEAPNPPPAPVATVAAVPPTAPPTTVVPLSAAAMPETPRSGMAGLSAASSAGRCTSAMRNRSHVVQVRRWARIRRDRETRPSPSDSARWTASQCMARPSSQSARLLRASYSVCFTARALVPSASPICSWLRPLSSRITRAPRCRSGRSCRSARRSESRSRVCTVRSTESSGPPSVSSSSAVAGRRRTREIASLCAILKSHGRSARSRPSVCNAENAFSIAFCNASRASCSFPRIERQ
ncbi:unannotated protein [freshwater metagenome]|uniref:Unannotated protein n=1 Tax=freshwater metagenome TaxID=449393 RepID=A0A6J7H9G1_9ZZZZ